MSTKLTPEQRAIFASGAATVTFEDHGQDFLRFHIKDRRVVGCEPFQADVWCGMEVACFPEVGKLLGVRRADGYEMSIKYPILKVEPLWICPTHSRPWWWTAGRPITPSSRTAFAWCARSPKRNATPRSWSKACRRPSPRPSSAGCARSKNRRRGWHG